MDSVFMRLSVQSFYVSFVAAGRSRIADNVGAGSFHFLNRISGCFGINSAAQVYPQRNPVAGPLIRKKRDPDIFVNRQLVKNPGT